MPYLSQTTSDLYFQQSGMGSPAMLIHGLGANSQQPLDLVGELPGFSIAAPDMLGHGKSLLQTAKVNPGFMRYIEDVHVLMNELKMKKAMIGGISMGSGISLGLALKYPERVSALILHRPAWLDKPMPENLIALPIIADLINELGAEAGKAFFRRTDFFHRIQQRSPGCSQSLLRQFDRPQAQEAAEVLWKLSMDAPFSNFESLRNLHIPALVMASKDDPLHPLDFGKQIADALPEAEFVEIVSNYTDSSQHKAETRKAINSFLSRI